MTLDDSAYVSMREAVRRGHEDDQARAEAEWREQQLCEHPDAEDARWSYRWRLWAREHEPVHYAERPGIDRRLHDHAAAVADGLLPEDP